MKLATYEHDGAQSFGVVMSGGVCDVPSVWPDGPGSVLEALQTGAEALKEIAARTASGASLIPLESVKLLAPIPEPPKVIGLAGNYVKHIEESRLAKGLSKAPHTDTVPRPFLMPATAVAGPGAVVPWCDYSREIDYEIELAIVIGSCARRVQPDQAGRHIAGYTIANDVSARSVTFSEGRSVRPWDDFYDWLNGKWADGFCPTGPWLVTADEVGDVSELELELKVNGQVRQKALAADMIFDPCEIVSFLSHLMTLVPGDLIATGTPSGVGMADGRFLSAGDEITCRIDRIGEMSFTIGSKPGEFYTPCKK